MGDSLRAARCAISTSSTRRRATRCSRARAGHAAGGVRARRARLRGARRRRRSPAYLWAWLENQVLAAMKLVPLGQIGRAAACCSRSARAIAAVVAQRDGAATTTISATSRPGSRIASARARDAVLAAVPLLSLTRSMTADRQPLRVGIGGPVGSGKTALTLALCRALRDRYEHRRRHQRHLHRGGRAVPGAQRGARARAHHRRRDRRLPAHGDPRGRVDQPRGGRPARAALPATSTSIFIESGGDNLAATFSPELSDLTLYVIDVAAGDKIPRKGGPGITQLGPAGHQQDRPRARWSARRSR